MNCYCQSGSDFSDCCRVFILGQQLPDTAVQLMRSRFSSYCDGSNAALQYIANTYHPLSQAENPIHEITTFAKAAHFISLQVIDVSDELSLPEDLPQLLPKSSASDSLSYGTVHFKVQFIMQDKLHLLEEKSRFIRTNQQWSYLDGELFNHPPQKLSRNDSCPCQSGKKYKNCQPHKIAGQNFVL